MKRLSTVFSLQIAREFSDLDIQNEVEKTIEYPRWRHLVVELMSRLPPHTQSLRDWGLSIAHLITDIIGIAGLAVREDRAIPTIIRIKSRIKIGRSFSTAFLAKPLYKFFEKRSSSEVTVSSIHGVKGESFDAILLLIMSNREKLRPSTLSNGSLDSEELRIAYVAMTRPRKLLVVAMPKQRPENLNRFPTTLWDYHEL